MCSTWHGSGSRKHGDNGLDSICCYSRLNLPSLWQRPSPPQASCTNTDGTGPVAHCWMKVDKPHYLDPVVTWRVCLDMAHQLLFVVLFIAKSERWVCHKMTFGLIWGREERRSDGCIPARETCQPRCLYRSFLLPSHCFSTQFWTPCGALQIFSFLLEKKFGLFWLIFYCFLNHFRCK